MIKYKNLMGSTGEGITCEDEIDMSRENLLTRAWSTIKKEFPWYFEMRQFEGDRPSHVPNGLGHSGTAININLLKIESMMPYTASSKSDLPEDNGGGNDTNTWHPPEWELDYEKLAGIDSEFNPESLVAADLDGKEENIAKQVGIKKDKKGKGTENVKPTKSSTAKKKTAAHPSISSPAIKPDNSASTASKKSKNPADRFV